MTATPDNVSDGTLAEEPTSYCQLNRKGTTKGKNTVPFLADVLEAKIIKGNGQYCYTEVRVVSGGNQWEQDYGMGPVFYQHVTVTDNYTTWTIVTVLVDPTEPYEEDDEMKTWKFRFRGTTRSEYEIEGYEQ